MLRNFILCSILLCFAGMGSLSASTHPAYQGLNFSQPGVPDVELPYDLRVNPVSGNLLTSMSLFSHPAAGVPVEVFLVYNSDLSEVQSPFGHGWSLSIFARYSVAGNQDIFVRWGDGHQDRLIWTGSDYQPPVTHAGMTATLDGNGLRLTTGSGIQYQFSAAQQVLTAVTDPLGRGLQIGTNAYGWPMTVAHTTMGTTYSLTYNNGHLSEVRENDRNRIYTMSYDGNGNLQTITDPLAQNFGWSYDGAHRLIGRSLPGARSATLTWSNALPATVQIGAAQWTMQFESGTRALILTEPEGSVWKYIVNYEQQVSRIEDPLQHSIQFVFDTAGRAVAVTDRTGGTSSLAWDGRGNLVSSTDAAGRTTLFRYDSRFDLLSEREDAQGGIWRTVYNGLGLPVAITDPVGVTTRYFWNASGQLTAATLPNGSQKSYSYDGRGNLNLVTYSDGTTTAFHFDDADRLLRLSNAQGQSLRYTYDNLDRRLSETNLWGQTQSFTYDEMGNVLTLNDFANRDWTFTYDKFDRRVIAQDPLGNSETWTYNRRGELIAQTDRRNNPTQWTVNQLGLATSVQPSQGGAWSFEYDAEGRVISRKAPDGNVLVAYQYDPVGYPTRAIYSWRRGTAPSFFNFVVDFSYDAAGSLTLVTQTNGSFVDQAWFWYDLAGRVTATVEDGIETSVDDRFETRYVYDSAGRLMQKYLPTGFRLGLTSSNQIEYVYDPMDRLVQQTIVAEANDLSGGAPGKTTQTIVSLRNQDGAVTMQTVIGQLGSALKTTRFHRNSFGEVTLTSNAVPDFSSWDHRLDTRYLRNGQHQITETVWNLDYPGHFGPTRVTSAVYLHHDQLGRVTAQTEYRQGDGSGGSSFGMLYDAAGEVTGGWWGETGGQLYQVMITRDTLGRTTAYFDESSGTTLYTYNSYGQLINESGPLGDRQYSYDARNRMRRLEMLYPNNVSYIEFSYGAMSRMTRYRVIWQNGGYTKRFAYGSPTPVEIYNLNSFDGAYQRSNVLAFQSDGSWSEGGLASSISSIDPRGIAGSVSGNWAGWSHNVVYPGSVGDPQAPVAAGSSYLEPGLPGGQLPYPASVRWPPAPGGDAYSNPIPHDIFPTAIGEERWNFDFELGDSQPLIAQPRPIGESPGSHTINLTPLTRSLAGEQDVDFATSVDPCGGTAYRNSALGAVATLNDPAPRGGIPDSDDASRLVSTMNLGVEISSRIAGMTGKVMGKVFAPLAAGYGAWQEYNLSRSYGTGKGGSVLNSGGSFTFDLAYAAPGLIDSGVSMITGKDLGLVSTFKNAYRVPLACLSGNDDQLVDSMRNGQCGGVTMALSNCGYKLGEVGYDMYHQGKTQLNHTVKKAKKAYSDVRTSIKKRGVAGTVKHYIGKGAKYVGGKINSLGKSIGLW